MVDRRTNRSCHKSHDTANDFPRSSIWADGSSGVVGLKLPGSNLATVEDLNARSVDAAVGGTQ